LEALYTELDKRESLHRDKYNQFKDDKIRVQKVLDKKPKNKTKARKIGFRDWTNIACNINIQSGCSNDCRYCYAKIQAYRRKQVALGKWTNETIRKAEVDRPRKFYSGLVGFPSTHDITLQNVPDYLNVLGKLLRAGNEVLIVSKARLECIQKICEASQFFRDKILFRFTIGANDDDILGFWEPNAPSYAERKEALKYAFDSGFRTSASIEPMLDSANVVSLVNDLVPLISEDIWIGKMNHIKGFANDADKDLKIRLKQIEEGQTKERLEALHKALDDKPKVKWKTGS
jgi:DNA repair photolyase